MRRFIAGLLAFSLLAVTLSGCVRADSVRDGKISVVCTIFPEYDWARQIIGDDADDIDLTLLLSSGIDIHNYQPTTADIVKISTCDLFIYVGGESDKWVNDALRNAANKDMIVISLMDALGGAAKDDDEHVWLSLKNARIFCPVIAGALSSLIPSSSADFNDNLDVYMAKLAVLDAEYQTAAGGGRVKTLLFGDRFPFRYLMEDYGIRYYAAFPGCTTETEASFGVILSLAQKADELDLTSVVVTESSDKSIAKAIISNTETKDQRILVMNAMQSITQADVRNGSTYLSIMESNLSVLKDALK